MTFHSITFHYTALIELHDMTLHYTALHCTAHITLHYITSHYITPRYNPLHYTAYITLYYITLPYITLHGTTLNYITYITLHCVPLHMTWHAIKLHWTHYFRNQCSHEVASACLSDVHDVLPHARGRAASSSRRLSRHGADMANGKYGWMSWKENDVSVHSDTGEKECYQPHFGWNQKPRPLSSPLSSVI